MSKLYDLVNWRLQNLQMNCFLGLLVDEDVACATAVFSATVDELGAVLGLQINNVGEHVSSGDFLSIVGECSKSASVRREKSSSEMDFSSVLWRWALTVNLWKARYESMACRQKAKYAGEPGVRTACWGDVIIAVCMVSATFCSNERCSSSWKLSKFAFDVLEVDEELETSVSITVIMSDILLSDSGSTVNFWCCMLRAIPSDPAKWRY